VVARPDDADRFLAMVTPEKNLIPRLGVLALGLSELRTAVARPGRASRSCCTWSAAAG